jgi:protein O-GlcNAc transferase
MKIDKAFQLAHQYYQAGDLNQASNICKKILRVKPNSIDVLHFLEMICCQLGDFDDAIRYIRKEIELSPTNANAYYNLGLTFQNTRQLDEAIACYQKAIQLNPNFAEAYNNLGFAFQDRGQSNEAEIYFRRVLQITPDDCISYGNLLFNMNYNSRHNSQDILSEHLLFAKKFAEPLYSAISPHTNERQPNKRLRIGYLSPDFRRHAVAYFIEPVLVAHNREHFEVFCYSNSLVIDEVSRRIQEYTDQWRTVVGISDAEVTELIRKDKIDILVDLAGHTGNNRILLFARKPAPIQVTWIGYPATTGLSQMNYKIVDNFTNPKGITEKYYTEELVRLPETFLCYLPPSDSPNVVPLPAIKDGYITFGSFNNFAKVSPEILDLWISILKAVPNSHLIIKAKCFSDIGTRDYVMDIFNRKGIITERIELLSWETSMRSHLGIYNRIDIGLDTFPYNGTTTTCEAIWMGVPVITLAGNQHASRVGCSLLSNIGISELIATIHEEYLGIAINLASDIEKLQLLRKSLRDRMSHSPLTDAKRFTANLEMCYRKMWERWCTST